MCWALYKHFVSIFKRRNAIVVFISILSYFPILYLAFSSFINLVLCIFSNFSFINFVLLLLLFMIYFAYPLTLQCGKIKLLANDDIILQTTYAFLTFILHFLHFYFNTYKC